MPGRSQPQRGRDHVAEDGVVGDGVRVRSLVDRRSCSPSPDPACSICNTPNVLRLRFIVRGRTVVINHASSDNCFVSRALAADQTATTLRLLPSP
jgi:hypothetical protein